jgi:hypothetical protein
MVAARPAGLPGADEDRALSASDGFAQLQLSSCGRLG